QVLATVESAARLNLAEPFTSQFTAISDLTAFLAIEFTRARSHRGSATVSYDVQITNTGTNTVLLPLVLELDPTENFIGQPLGATGRSANGSWLIDLSSTLSSG